MVDGPQNRKQNDLRLEEPATTSMVGLGESLKLSIEQFTGQTPVYAEGVLWTYDQERVVWEPQSDRELRGLLHCYDGRKARSGDAVKISQRLISGAIQYLADECWSADYFAKAPRTIGFQNAVAVIGPDFCEVTDPKPEHRLRHVLPYDLAPEGTETPVYDRFMRELGFADPERESIEEVIFATMAGLGPKYAHSVLLYGHSSQNGKSTLLDLVTKLLGGNEAVTSVSPEQMRNPQNRALLAGDVRMNVVAELGRKSLDDLTEFKKSVTGDLMDAKIVYREPFTFRFKGVNWFATNEEPGETMTGAAEWRRFLVFEFPNQFTGENVDRDILAKLFGELPAIARRVVEAGNRLLARGSYLVTERMASLKLSLQTDSNPVAQWLTEVAEPAEERSADDPSSVDLKPLYEQWAKLRGLDDEPMTVTKFGRLLSDALNTLGWPGKYKNSSMRYQVRLLDEVRDADMRRALRVREGTIARLTGRGPKLVEDPEELEIDRLADKDRA
jgi:phage/plasmid-associated DNA primase